MLRAPVTLCIAVLIFCLSLSAHAATAQRTFVASHGIDNPACSISSPCRGFVAAAAQTSPGGEIIVLDSAGYGAVTITQSVSIIAPAGVYAGISVFSGDGITINGAGISVVLRGLDINGQGGNRGIAILDAGSVSVERTSVRGMAGDGIEILAPANATFADIIVRDCNGNGIYILPTLPSFATVSIERARIEQNTKNGVYVDNDVTAAIVDSTITRNVMDGILIWPDTTEFVDITLVRNTISENLINGVHVKGAGVGNVFFLDNAIFRQNFGHGILDEAASIGLFSRGNNFSANALVDSPASFVSGY